jgi:hypothetical protein
VRGLKSCPGNLAPGRAGLLPASIHVDGTLALPGRLRPLLRSHLLWLLPLLLSGLAAAVTEPPAPRPSVVAPEAGDRPLSLNQFRWSRRAQQDRNGFYFQPVGLCEDYPEETTTPEKIRRDYETLRQVGAQVFRFGIGWDAIQEGPERYDWRHWDTLINLASRYGVTLIPYVAYTPRWLGSERRGFWSAPPTDLEKFGDFMGAIARRYRGQVRAWELWNEPDNRDFWRGSAAEYAWMVQLGARRVREADPTAIIVLGGMAREPEPFFVELMTRHQIDRHVDVINMHGYLETWENRRAEAYPARIKEYAAFLERSSAPDFWLAEFGYSSYRRTPAQVSEGVDAIHDYEHTPRYQAVALFKHHVMALSTGRLSLTAWYRVNDLPAPTATIGDDNNKHLGILDLEGRPKPAFHALRFYRRLFDEPSRCIDGRVKLHAPPGSHCTVHAFEEKDGDLVVVGWLRSARRAEVDDRTGMARDRRRETVDITLPRRGFQRLQVYDVAGQPRKSVAAWSSGRLRSVVLTGSDLFIAELKAARSITPRPSPGSRRPPRAPRLW